MKIFFAFVLLFISSLTWATVAPYHPYEKEKFDAIDTLTGSHTSTLSSHTSTLGSHTTSLATLALVDANVIADVSSVTTKANRIQDFSAASLSVDGINAERTVRSTFDFAVDGNGIAAYDLGEDLPAKAVISSAVIYVVTQLADGGSGTLALHCEDANNILTASDITGSAAGAIIAGTATYATPVAGITSACNITATVAGAALTAGKINIWIRYYIHD